MNELKQVLISWFLSVKNLVAEKEYWVQVFFSKLMESKALY
jgi:hypothetical protein